MICDMIKYMNRIFRKNIIPYHLQWETRDFVAKVPILKFINTNTNIINSNTLTRYGETCKSVIPFNKQWESKDFYRKYEK